MADVPGKFFSATKVRTGVAPSSSGSIVGEPLPPVNPPGSSLNSVGLTMPSAFTVSNSPLTANGTIGVAGAGTVGQYIRGDGSLADFPQASGGGSSVSYYLNGSISQGTIGGVAYKELNKVPILGAGTDFTINADGYIASFITDVGDPNLLEIPGGNWNFETYFSASSSGGTPTFYVELYKYDGTTFTLIASSSSSPELIAFGTNLNPYFSTLAVPTTTLALTDRLAIRYYVTHSGRTITLHTENNHLCQVVTTFTTGLTSLNGLTAQVQNLAVGTSGTDFNIASATATHTFNLPTASATNRGALSSADWSLFTQAYNDKINSAAVTGTTTKTLTLTQQDGGTITASWSDLNTDAVTSVFGRTGAVVAANGDYTTAQVTESGNLYYTEARVSANTDVAANTAARHNAVTLGTANGLSLSTQQLSLALASGSTTGALSSTDWTTFNNKQNALGYVPVPETRTITINGTSQDLSANRTYNVGTVTSVAALTLGTSGTDLSSTVANGTTTPVITLNVPTASATNRGALSAADWTTFNNKQNALTNPVTGTGSAGQVAYWSSSSAITGESNLFWDATNDRLGIGSSATPTPVAGVKFPLLVTSDAVTRIRIDSTQATPNAGVGLYANGVQKFSFAMFGTTSDFTIYNDALLSSSILVKGDTNNILINDNNDLGQKLRLGGRFALRASATASATTQVPVFVSDPSSTTTELLTRTPAQFRSDIGAQAALTNPVTGTGTTNYLPKFTGSTTIGNSQVFDNGTSVGIATTSLVADALLPIQINAGVSGQAYFASNNNGNYGLIMGYDNANGYARIRNVSNTPLTFETSNTERLRIWNSTGNVNIGPVPSSDSGYKLDVNGTGRFSGRLLVSHATSGNYGAVIYNTSATGEGLTVRGGSTSSHSALIIQPYDGSVSLLNILATGAATFNLGSGEMRLNRTGTSEFLKLNTYYLLSDGNDQLLGSVTGATSIYAGNGVSPRLTITSGGNVGIGTTTYSMTAGYTGLGINNATNGGALDLLLNDVKKGELYITSTSFNMYGFAGVGLNLTVDNNSSKGLSIATTGAATFSSFVNATNLRVFKSSFRGGLFAYNDIFGSGSDHSITVFAESGIDNGNIYFCPNGSSTRAMTINTSGNVLIGTTTDNGSKLRVNGSLALPHVTKSANYTLDGTDYTVGFDCASNRTATLPDATTCSGRIYVIYQYNTGSGARSVTLDGNGSQTINGATTYSLYPYCDFTSVMIQSNGSNWIIIASNLTADCL